MHFDSLRAKFDALVLVNCNSEGGNLLAGLLFCESKEPVCVLTDPSTGMKITVEVPEELRETQTFVVGYDIPLPLISISAN